MAKAARSGERLPGKCGSVEAHFEGKPKLSSGLARYAHHQAHAPKPLENMMTTIPELSEKELEQIRRRWDEFSEVANPGYRAFMRNAHRDMGRLLDEIDRIRRLNAVQWVPLAQLLGKHTL